MNTFMNWLADSFVPKSNKILSKPWISALGSTMQKVIPFILTGSVIFLYNVLVSFFPSLPDLGPISDFSFGIISLIVAFTIANQCMEKLGHPSYMINAGIASIGVFLMVAIPIGEDADSISALMNHVSASGIAVAMITGLFTSIIFHLWAKLQFLKDSSIPDFVSSWINTVVPNLISLGVIMIMVKLMEVNVYAAIISIFTPLIQIGQTLPSLVLMCFTLAFFYTLGISSWTFNAITTPILMAGVQANLEQIAAGQAATHIVSHTTFWSISFITMGGVCATLALNVLMCFSKSKQLKMLGKVFLVPSIFNINEPLMYGAKVVFNPLLMIPAWINAIVGPVYVWVIMSLGLLNIPAQMMEIGQVPAPISSVLATQDIRAVLWWIILFLIYGMIWYPFFKVYEKQKLKEETTAAVE